ncbi:helix-turn-helix domain-containing protein [Candidatus Marsarchaeota archaeon]|jgi:predicted transcriptional regulator|nr:helix-turn-helix domain-containing protein [Candidatus Marsarchaeota archaeon]
MVFERDNTIKMAIPAVRIAVVRILKSRYRFGQEEIAKRMGITQAAVNKYLNGRYSGKTGKIMMRIKERGLDAKVAGMVAAGKRIPAINEQIDRIAAGIGNK